MHDLVRVLGAGALALCLAYVAWLALLWSMQRSMIFPAPAATGARVAPPGIEQVWLQLPFGRTEAWYLPPLAGGDGPHPAIVFTHGNAELIDDWGREFDEPRSWGVAVLLVEYPGYGRSMGRPSQQTITAAVLAGYDWLARRADVDPTRLVAYGRSVGGGAACALAARRPVRALVLESSFTSVADMAGTMGVPAFLVRDHFDNLAVVKATREPVLIIHGTRDEIIPVSHGRALHRAAPQSEYFEVPCGHNDCPHPWMLLARFLRAHAIIGGANAPRQ